MKTGAIWSAGSAGKGTGKLESILYPSSSAGEAAVSAGKGDSAEGEVSEAVVEAEGEPADNVKYYR
jgi:hypothetical protein